MILHRLRLINKNQRGVTLIELLIALLISGVITGGITMSIFQVFDGNARTTNRMIAVKQVQNAGYWISRHVQMTQSIAITGVSGFPLTLTWTEWDGTGHQVVYSLEDMTGGFKQLERQHLTYDAEGNEVGNETTIVAQYIDPDNTSCEVTGGGGGAFSLPNGSGPQDDAFTITDAVGGDYGTITVTASGDVVKATPTGTAIVGGVIFPNTLTINIDSGTVAWTTPAAGDTVIVTGNAMNSTGSWTSTTGTATATIITDNNGDATLSGGDVLILTITATVGDGSRAASETRVYRVVSRPNL